MLADNSDSLLKILLSEELNSYKERNRSIKKSICTDFNNNLNNSTIINILFSALDRWFYIA